MYARARIRQFVPNAEPAELLNVFITFHWNLNRNLNGTARTPNSVSALPVSLVPLEFRSPFQSNINVINGVPGVPLIPNDLVTML